MYMHLLTRASSVWYVFSHAVARKQVAQPTDTSLLANYRRLMRSCMRYIYQINIDDESDLALQPGVPGVSLDIWVNFGDRS